MTINSLVGLAAAGIFLCSCQSNSYHIDGFANKFQEGDTICLTKDDHLGHSIAQTVVKDGRFHFWGETDSIGLFRVYVKQESEYGVSFFLEPGHITIELLPQQAMSRVSGTVINNEWQLLSDSIIMLAKDITMQQKETVNDSIEQKKRAHAIDSLHQRMSTCILNTAARNKDNQLGKYIQENYKAPEF
jgi:hypothetical protein